MLPEQMMKDGSNHPIRPCSPSSSDQGASGVRNSVGLRTRYVSSTSRNAISQSLL
jgi:hypothetical protein